MASTLPKQPLTQTQAAGRLAAEVMAVFTTSDERENGFEVIHLHGFIDAYEEVRRYEKVLTDAQRVIDEAFAQKEAKK